MVVVVGDVSGAVVDDLAFEVNEAIPDRRAATVLVDRTLDLIRRRRGAP
jgi:hypothetical protein